MERKSGIKENGGGGEWRESRRLEGLWRGKGRMMCKLEKRECRGSERMEGEGEHGGGTGKEVQENGEIANPQIS
jgi:hypothetical protein